MDSRNKKIKAQYKGEALELEFLTPKQVAEILQVSVRWLARNRHSKDPIAFKKDHNRVFYERSSIAEWWFRKEK
jgi:hypothetical protein